MANVTLTWEDAHRLYAGMNALQRLYESDGYRESPLHDENMEHTRQLRARMWQAMQDSSTGGTASNASPIKVAPGCDGSDPMMQEVWITIRLKGELNANADARNAAETVLAATEAHFKTRAGRMIFNICQPGDVIEVEEEAQIYNNEKEVSP